MTTPYKQVASAVLKRHLIQKLYVELDGFKSGIYQAFKLQMG